MRIKTEAVDKICLIPGIGTVIGLSTSLINTIRLVVDTAKILFFSMLSIRYQPTEALKRFENLNAEFDKNFPNCKMKPRFSFLGVMESNVCFPVKPELLSAINGLTEAHLRLSNSDEAYMFLTAAKKRAREDIHFIGRGLIRAIPIVGPLALCRYHVQPVVA